MELKKQDRYDYTLVPELVIRLNMEEGVLLSSMINYSLFMLKHKLEDGSMTVEEFELAQKIAQFIDKEVQLYEDELYNQLAFELNDSRM